MIYTEHNLNTENMVPYKTKMYAQNQWDCRKSKTFKDII